MWTIPDYGDVVSPPDLAAVPRAGFQRLFAGQQAVGWRHTGTAAGGQSTWSLSAPAAGVHLFGAEALPWRVTLPDGSAVELADELVPAANRLGLPSPSALPWFVDRGLRLRVRRGATTLAEGWLQRPSVLLGSLRLAAGLTVDTAGDLVVYAHAGIASTATLALEGSPVVSPLQDRLASPFGRGVTLTAPAGPGDPVGEIEATATPVRVAGTDHPARSWFAHDRPLDDVLLLTPDATPIIQRPTDRIAWGRHRANVASGPLAWSLSSQEAGGHAEWITVTSAPDRWLHHPAASPLWHRGRPPALLPAAAHRVNLSADPAVNGRLATIRASWAEPLSGWATGEHDLGQPLGGWCEWRDATWGTAPAYQWTDLAGTVRSVTGSALWVGARRVDATNLGTAATQADAVEITRWIFDWAAVVRLSVTPQFGAASTDYRGASGTVVLSEADAAALAAGDPVTIAGSYLQGDYPTRTTAAVGGTLTLRAVG